MKLLITEILLALGIVALAACATETPSDRTSVQFDEIISWEAEDNSLFITLEDGNVYEFTK